MTPWITHSLLDPETIPAKGEVKKLDAESIFLWRVLSCLGAGAPVGDGCSLTYSCWWVEAEEVCSTTKITNEASTIRQMTQEIRRSNEASEEDAPELAIGLD